jgi:hypothetical protein
MPRPAKILLVCDTKRAVFGRNETGWLWLVRREIANEYGAKRHELF